METWNDLIHGFRLGPLDVGGREADACGGLASGELVLPAVLSDTVRPGNCFKPSSRASRETCG